MADKARDNEAWVAQLGSKGGEQQNALSDLRNLLMRRLHRAMLTRGITENSFIEDAVQDALLLILERLQQFQGRSQFITWATSIAIHAAMTRFRRKSWNNVSLDELMAGSGFMQIEPVDEQSGPDVQYGKKAMLEKMYLVIRDELTQKQKTALLAELKGMPLDEIASQLNTNRNAVYKLTHDARKRLKNGLEVAGYSVDDINEAFIA